MEQEHATDALPLLLALIRVIRVIRGRPAELTDKALAL